MGTSNHWTRVIVLTPPPPEGHGLGEALKASFAARDWFAVEQHDPHLALAELCLREKSQVARSAWGLQRMEQLALVVVEPRHWNDGQALVNDLIQAVHRYVPAATVWTAEGDQVHLAQGSIASASRKAVALEIAASSAPHAARPGAARTGAPAPLRLTEAPPDSERQAEADDQNDADAGQGISSRLSREEIDMLLDMGSSADGREEAP